MGIIVSMVYMAYILFSSNVGGYAHFSNQFNNAQSFHSQMQKEFMLSDKITPHTENGFSILFYDNTTIDYFRKENWLYRRKDHLLDSLPVTSMDIAFLSKEDDIEKLVKEVSITTSIQGRKTSIFASKIYYSNYQQDLK